jgi:hypothetical protein
MRKIELFCGFVTGFMGLGALVVWVLSLPISVAVMDGFNGTITPSTIRDVAWGNSAFIYMSMLAILSILVTIGSLFHALMRSNLGRFLLWAACGFLCLGTICAFGLGILYWPSAIMGFACATASVLDSKLPRPTHVRA